MSVGVTVRLTGEWARCQAILNRHSAGAPLRAALNKALNREAQEFVRDVKVGIRTGSPGGKPLLPLRPLTVYRKRSNKPLIDNGDLVGSIRVVRVRSLEFFAGVNRTAHSKAGAPLANVAATHELGATIILRITPKMVGYFFALLRRLSGYAARRRSPGSQPTAGTSRSGYALPSFRPGAILIIRIRRRPFLQPVFDRRKGGVQDRVMRAVAAELHGDFGRG